MEYEVKALTIAYIVIAYEVKAFTMAYKVMAYFD